MWSVTVGITYRLSARSPSLLGSLRIPHTRTRRRPPPTAGHDHSGCTSASAVDRRRLAAVRGPGVGLLCSWSTRHVSLCDTREVDHAALAGRSLRRCSVSAESCLVVLYDLPAMFSSPSQQVSLGFRHGFTDRQPLAGEPLERSRRLSIDRHERLSATDPV